MAYFTPPRIHPEKKRIVKASLMRGDSAKKALENAGYSRKYNPTQSTVVRECIKELADYVMKDTTIENVLAELEYLRNVALEKGDISSAVRTAELKGKWLNMFKDSPMANTAIFSDKIGQELLEKLNCGNITINTIETTGEIKTDAVPIKAEDNAVDNSTKV